MKRTNFDRRRFAAGSVAGTLAALAAGRAPLALARSILPPDGAPEPHFFFFGQIYGAWDVCLAFDPKDRDVKLPSGERQFDQPYTFDEVKQYGNVRLAPAGQILAPYADKLAIVNGIDMEVDNGHIPDNMMAGVQSPRSINAPFMQAALARRHPFVRTTVLPHIYASYDGMFYAGPDSGVNVVAKSADVLKLLGASTGASYDAINALARGYQARLTSAADRRVAGIYADSTAKASEVTARLAQGGFVVPDDPESPSGLGSFVGQLFQRGILGSVTWSLGERYLFDTHSNHYAQHPLDKALADIALVAEAFAQVPYDANRSILDLTTIVLAGEFCRTPLLNGAQGKDHNLHTNSLAMFGKNVRSGVYGASGWREDNGILLPHAALPVDFATGNPSATGTIIKAKNLWAGVGAVFGADLSPDLGADVVPVTFFG